MASALARRTTAHTVKKTTSHAPAKRRSAIRKVGGAIARKASTHAAAAVRRVKADTRVKVVGYGTGGAVVGAVLEAKVSQIPTIKSVPKQLMIGGAALAAGFALKGKVAEGVLFAGLGPFLAGVSQLTTRLVTTGSLTLAGQDSSYGSGMPATVAGEFDDIAR